MDRVETPMVPDPALCDVLESIREPALLYLPGGRIAAVNRAAAALATGSVVGETLGALLNRNSVRLADGRPIIRSDLPCARALRGEIVSQGERVEITQSDGSVYRTLITSTPIVRDGRVVAALSVWHDFDAYARQLVQPPVRASVDAAGGP